ncbi:MAG: LysM domain-containing protein [Phycisphaerae bacterium]|jgi:hypothetical protein|nr:LysM domain-containing protein [Phycisphaerae bacterium]
MTRLTTLLLLIAFVISGAALSAEASEYIVRRNDTLSHIAQSQLGSSARWKEIATLNNIKPPYKLSLGQRLILPDVSSPAGRSETVEIEILPVEPPQIELPSNAPGAGLELPSQLWVCVLVALIVLWAFSVLCLRLGCWFSLVETSFMRCAFLSLVSAAVLMLILGILGGFGWLVVNQHMSPVVLPVATVILLLAYLVVSNILTKRILACKWRSVFTVSVMSSVVANLLAWGFMVILLITLPGLMATEVLREFVTAVIHAQ